MSDVSPKSKPRRRWLQFSMRGVLLFTVAAAVLSAWFIAPAERFRDFGRRGANVREEYVREIDPHTKQGVPVLHGRWQLIDEQGLVRVEGHIAHEKPSGRWTVLDAEGYPVIDGYAHDGLRVGDWTAWHGPNQPRSQGQFALSRCGKFESYGGYCIYVSYIAPAWRTWEIAVSLRTGETKVWWPNGQPRLTGSYAPNPAPIDARTASDLLRREEPELSNVAWQSPVRETPAPLEMAEGGWSTFDNQGRLMSQGSYRDGRRSGAWRFASGDAVKTVHYVAGEEVEDLEAEIARLTAQLQSAAFRERHRAMWRLLQLGDVVRPQLLAWLNGDDLERARMAAGALAQVGGDDPAILAALAAKGADASAPRDLRISILESLARATVVSQAAAAPLATVASPAESDRELRTAARVARVTLEPASFDDLAEALLIELASADPAISGQALTELNAVRAGSAKQDCAAALGRLDRSTRMAVATALVRYFGKYSRWGQQWPAAGDLVALLQADQDFAIRELAAKLRLPNEEDFRTGVGQGGAFTGGGMSGNWGSAF